MSRSRKKTPGFCDRNPFAKNQANRRIRRRPVDHEIADGGAYRKEYCSWNICDWRFLVVDHNDLYCEPYKARMK